MNPTRRFRRRAFCLMLFVSIALSGFARSPIDEFDRLSVAFSSGDLTFDPLHAYRTTELQIATGLYEGLVGYDPKTLRPVPAVAYRWDVSDDGRIYTFHLRRRAKFSNGDPVTATDFRESWLRIINPADEGAYSFFFDVIEGAFDYRKGKLATADDVGIRVIDPYTLEVRLTQPASHLLSMMCHMTFAAIHKRYRDSSGWERSAPLITNGPYSLAARDGAGLTLERNLSYWDSWNVDIDRIDISFGVGAEEASRRINEGTIDWSVTADADALDDKDIIQVAPLFATSYLFFRADEAPWSDARVRRGLALIVPWEQIRQAATPFATDSLVPAVGFYSDVDGLKEQNVSAGLALLEEAGYADGAGLPTITILVIPGSVADDAAREAAKVWRRFLDADVEIKGISFNDYQRVVGQGGFAMGSSTWIGDYADPLAFLQMWTAGSRLNDARYVDETFDALIAQAMGETGEQRFKTLSRAEQRLLTEEVVVIPLSHTVSVNFIDLDRVEGWYANALDVHPFKSIRFARPKVPPRYARAE